MEKEKTYTTTEVMEISGLTRAAVLKRARAFNFTKYCRYVLKKTRWGNYIKEFSFTESQVKQMGCDHMYQRKSVECNSQEDIVKADSLEELKREHPLVTDERCFKKCWWPETIPSILEENGE